MGGGLDEFSANLVDKLHENYTPLVPQDDSASRISAAVESVGVLTVLGEEPEAHLILRHSGGVRGGDVHRVLLNLADVTHKSYCPLGPHENGVLRVNAAVKSIGNPAEFPKELCEGSVANYSANNLLGVSLLF